MSVCNSCGGVLGRDCFNPQEGAWITQQMAAASQQPETGVATCSRFDSVQIENVYEGPRSIQLPAELIWRVDCLLREMNQRGSTSAPLEIHYEGIKEHCWVATLGGLSRSSSTAWGAISELGKAIESKRFNEQAKEETEDRPTAN